MIADINFHIKWNAIRNIDLNNIRDIIDEYYGTISTIDKNAESEYYIVKWTIESYSFQSSQKLGTYFIKSGGLVCDALHLNPLANFKQWYTPYEN